MPRLQDILEYLKMASEKKGKVHKTMLNEKTTMTPYVKYDPSFQGEWGSKVIFGD